MDHSDIESFTIVNDNDIPKYVVHGKEALHAQPEGCYHRAVHIFVEVMGGFFVLQLKSNDTENGGKWSSSASGHVRTEESYLEAAIRELKEELGLNVEVSDLDYVAILHPCEETNGEFVGVFAYLIDKNIEIIKPCPVEVVEVRILKMNDIIKDVSLNKDDYSPAFQFALSVFLSKNWA